MSTCEMGQNSGTDLLTGLLNKASFLRLVREEIDSRPGDDYSIIRLDINRFSVYNEVRGMREGDELLCAIAQRLKDAFGPALIAARFQSDHFVLLLPGDREDVLRFLPSVNGWLEEISPDYRISVAIGIYEITNMNLDVAQMCDRARIALLSVKSAFETGYAFYDESMMKRRLEEQELINGMDEALRSEQFVLYFQPQVNYENASVIGAEALVRWLHPKRGLLSPGAFVPLFEQHGLIGKLDQYVWDRCCGYVRKWRDQYLRKEIPPVSISVNVSRVDLYDASLCKRLVDLTTKHGIPTSALQLEITESAYMESPQQLVDIVNELQKSGFVIEMDDFGSGYSSLNTLKDVPVDILKLDMKFLDDCADSVRGGNILSSIIRMAHWLKLPIIAEGVETVTQADYLKSLGCVYMQGYFFSRPVPVDEFERLLEQHPTGHISEFKDTHIEGMAAFWDPSAQNTLLFNSFVGGAAIMEYRNGVLELSRANDNFYKTTGTTREKFLPVQTDLLKLVDEDSRERLIDVLADIAQTGGEYGLELKCKTNVGGVTRPWQNCRCRLLAKDKTSMILYVSIEDITDRKNLEFEQQAENERNQLLMQSTGVAIFDYDIDKDSFAYQLYIPGKGMVRSVVSHYYDHMNTVCDSESTKSIREVIDKISKSPSVGEFEFRANLWHTGMRWCRSRYVGVRGENGRVHRLVGQINDIQDIKDRAAASELVRQKFNIASRSYTFNNEMVNQMVSLFYDSTNTDGAIRTALALLGQYYELSRAYIFEDNEDHTLSSNTYEWCAPDVEPQKDKLQNVPYEAMNGRESYIARFDQSGVFYCPDVSALSANERAILEPQGIRSMLQYAIYDGSRFLGMIGFDECRYVRQLTDEQYGTLMIISRVIASYLRKMRHQDDAAFSADYRSSLENSAAYVFIINPETHEIIYGNKKAYASFGNNFIGKQCFRSFVGREEPCDGCPLSQIYDKVERRTVKVEYLDGKTVVTQLSPLRWNGRDMALAFCIDLTSQETQQKDVAPD